MKIERRNAPSLFPVTINQVARDKSKAKTCFSPPPGRPLSLLNLVSC